MTQTSTPAREAQRGTIFGLKFTLRCLVLHLMDEEMRPRQGKWSRSQSKTAAGAAAEPRSLHRRGLEFALRPAAAPTGCAACLQGSAREPGARLYV